MDRRSEKVNLSEATRAFAPELQGLARQAAALIDDPAIAHRVLAEVRGRAPDERSALAFLLRLAEQSREGLRAALRDQRRAAELVFCLGASELIAGGLIGAGGKWVELFDAGRRLAEAGGDPSSVKKAASREELATARQRSLTQIAIADLIGGGAVIRTVEWMSQLADDCIGAALALAARETGLEAIAERFCVIAMGKLGARELNLSSDIDLIYLLDGEGGALLEQARRLGEVLTEIVSTRCLRVDLRLRPGGSRAPLVASYEGAIGFYQAFGQTWERAALLRARAAAGAIAAGQRLIGELSRFIYRAYLDFDTIRDLRAMKQQIEDELRAPAQMQRNIKLGYGGIRELEFIVHALTLIYGGRDPRLRTANTIEALKRLAAYGYMEAGQAAELREAYLMLRNVEHKLQIAAGLQTHSLPADDEGSAVLAARLGYGKAPEASARFRGELGATRERVAQRFRAMLKPAVPQADAAVSAGALTAWRAASDPGQAAAALAALGFAHPEEDAAHLQLLACGPQHLRLTERRRESLERLGPLMIDEMRGLPDPDLVLRNLAAFFAAIGARTSFLALLEQHPATRRVLMRLFASSEYLSGLFIRHPEMIDTLVRSDLAAIRRAPRQLGRELHQVIAACEDFERRLDALRAFRHQEFLRIAIADLAGELEPAEVQEELSRLAEVVIGEALELAQAEAGARRALPENLKLCAIAMGRLGAGEMAYNSDLDLIFIYYLPQEAAASGREAASRVVQKLIAILEAPTREGYAYKLDLRLRPSGNAGPLVTSLEGFHAYHAQSSALWERQALVRARVIAGDRALSDEIELARRKFVYEAGLDAAGVEEIRAMRMRIERELGQENAARLNLKHGPGGLLDVEFLSQMMALRHGREVRELRVRATLAMLRAIEHAGLLPQAQAAQLGNDYFYLSRLENRLRIETDQAATALPRERERLLPIARRMGFTGADAAARLLDEVEARRARIRATFDDTFTREAGKAAEAAAPDQG